MPCENCFCYEQHRENPDTGICHRYPPTPSFVPGQPLGVPYPTIVYKSYWCAEWLSKNTPSHQDLQPQGLYGAAQPEEPSAEEEKKKELFPENPPLESSPSLAIIREE